MSGTARASIALPDQQQSKTTTLRRAGLFTRASRILKYSTPRNVGMRVVGVDDGQGELSPWSDQHMADVIDQ